MCKVERLEAKVNFLKHWLVEACREVDFLTNATYKNPNISAKENIEIAIKTKLDEFEKQFSKKYDI
tara:strand:- start:7317 stop:7514 length:198 start_codon:yes stop_codon:yes gene_type:complete